MRLKTILLQLIVVPVIAFVAFPIVKGVLYRTGVTTPEKPEYLTNPQTAMDFAQRCDAMFTNAQEEIIVALKKNSSAKIDKKNQYQQAIFNCDRAIQLDPKLADAYGWRGNSKTALGETKAALIDYEKAQALLREQGRERQAQGIARIISIVKLYD